MNLIKVSSQDFKSTKLISANDLKSLREKGLVNNSKIN